VASKYWKNDRENFTEQPLSSIIYDTETVMLFW